MLNVRHIRILLVGLCMLLSACSSGGSTGGSSASQTSGPTPRADSPRLSAKGLAFDKAVLQLPAGQSFALVFDNQEAMPHNVSIHAADGRALFTGEVFTGPAQRVYVVPALPAGTYSFQCDVHPQMKGAATAQ